MHALRGFYSRLLRVEPYRELISCSPPMVVAGTCAHIERNVWYHYNTSLRKNQAVVLVVFWSVT